MYVLRPEGIKFQVINQSSTLNQVLQCAEWVTYLGHMAGVDLEVVEPNA